MIPDNADPNGPLLEALLSQIQGLELIDQPSQSHGRWYSHLLAFHIRGREPVLLPVKIPLDFFLEETDDYAEESEE